MQKQIYLVDIVELVIMCLCGSNVLHIFAKKDMPLTIILTLISINSDFDSTNNIMVKSFPTLFPGGIGDVYDDKRGEVSNSYQWANHLIRYQDGRFENHRIWSLYTDNWLKRNDNGSNGGFFLKTFLGTNPPTLQQLEARIKQGDTTFISKIQHFSAKIRGSPAYWRLQRHHLTTWMYYHAEKKHGPPTLFMTFSCAENHWGDLADILAGRIATYDTVKAAQLQQRNFKVMCEAARDHPLTVAEFFQKRLETWLSTVGKDVFKIKYHWGAYEFAPGRGMIHIHLLAIADNMEVMRSYYRLRAHKEKQLEYIARYAREELFMTAEHPAGNNKDLISVPEGTAQKADFMPDLHKSYSECHDTEKDLLNLTNGCSMHFCNDNCLRHSKQDKNRTGYVI